MGQLIGTCKSPSKKFVKDIKRATRTQYSSEDKVRIVLDEMRGEGTIALRWREGNFQDTDFK